MPVPTAEQVFSYGPTALPVLSSDPSTAKPIGVGPVAGGGTTVQVAVNIGPFVSPVDVSFAVYSVGIDSGDVYLLDATNTFEPLSRVVASRPSRGSSEDDGEDSGHRNDRLVKWRSNVTSVNENVFGPAPLSNLQPGPYVLVLGVTPSNSSDDDDNSYHWVTYFIVP
jgi:hypothetical protein